MKFMERDDRNALRFERELRQKYLEKYKKDDSITDYQNSPGFEQFKRSSSIMNPEMLFGFRKEVFNKTHDNMFGNDSIRKSQIYGNKSLQVPVGGALKAPLTPQNKKKRQSKRISIVDFLQWQ